MALMDDESRRLLQQSLHAQQQMLSELQGVRSSLQVSADMARRFTAQQAQQRQQESFNSPEPQNGDAHPVGSQAGIRQAMAAPGERGDQTLAANQGGYTTPVENAAQNISQQAQEPPAAPQGPEPSGSSHGGSGGTPPPRTPGGATTPNDGSSLGGPGSLISRVPVVGGALSSVMNNTPFGQIVQSGKKALNFYSSQRDKDDYYRSIEGGDHLSAMQARFGEEVASYKNILTMSPGESKSMYKDITRMGFTDNQSSGAGNNYTRGDLMDYVTHAKNTMGMSESESLPAAQVALQGANTSLQQFINILEQTSVAATKAGVNTQMARQMLVSYTQTAQQQGMGGGATSFAQSVTTANMAMGKRYAQGVDSSGVSDLTRQYMAAAQSGMSIGQLQKGLGNNDPRATAAMQRVQSHSLETIFGADNVAWIRDYKKNNPDVKSDALGKAFRDHMLTVRPNVAIQTYASQVAGLAGVQFDNPDDAFTWAAGQAVGTLTLKNNKQGINKAKPVKGLPKNESPIAGGIKAAAKEGAKDGLFGIGGLVLGHSSGIKNAIEGALGIGHGSSGDSIKSGAKKKLSNQEKATIQSIQSDPHLSRSQKDAMLSALGSTGSSTPQSKITVELSPDAKKLLKAMVVTGGDPYAQAGSASSGRPNAQPSTHTR